MLKKTLAILILISLGLVNFSFVKAQDATITPETIINNLPKVPGTIGDVWTNEVLPILKNMWDKFYSLAGAKIVNWFKTSIQPRIKQEIDIRKPIIKEEFQKEKDEVKQEAPGLLQSLWEKLKALVK